MPKEVPWWSIHIALPQSTILSFEKVLLINASPKRLHNMMNCILPHCPCYFWSHGRDRLNFFQTFLAVPLRPPTLLHYSFSSATLGWPPKEPQQMLQLSCKIWSFPLNWVLFFFSCFTVETNGKKTNFDCDDNHYLGQKPMTMMTWRVNTG